jgi:phage-related protein
MLEIGKGCQKEIAELPEEVRKDLADLIARLEEGHMLSMPISRPMPSIGKRVHELRLKDKSGVYRVIYVLIEKGRVGLLHAFKKTTQETPKLSIELAKKRLKEMQS